MLLKLLSLLTKPDRRKGSLLLVLMLFGAFFEALGIGLIIPILDTLDQSTPFPSYLEPLKDYVGNEDPLEFVIVLFFLLMIFFLVKNIYLGFLYWLQYKYVYITRANLSSQIFKWYLNESLIFHKSRNSAKLLNSLVNDTNIFASHGILPALIIFTESMVLLAITALLLSIEPLSMVVFACLLGAIMGSFFLLTKNKINEWGKKRIQSETNRVKSIHHGLGSIKEILLRGSQNYFMNDYDFHNFSVASVMGKQATIQSYPRLLFESTTILLLFLFIFISSSNNASVEQIIATITIFAFAAIRLMPSISRLVGAYQNMRFARPVIEDFYEDISSIQKEYLLEEQTKHLEDIFLSKITLKNISFKYETSNQLIIENLSYDIKFGECVGIVGKSGSGKSTLADIILGFLEPTSGNILIDNISLNDIKEQWQKNIGYVPQDVYLLDDSIESNIAFGITKDEINYELLHDSVKMAQLEEFIKTLPEGIKSVVGEHGSNISGGQRQRIGIARALYNKPSLLVFDEATSSLDIKTEKDFVDSVNSLKGKITMIVIAHRKSALEACDKVIDLSRT